MELAWLKKKSAAMGSEAMRTLIDPAESNPSITVARQCELLGLPRSSYYYPPAPPAEEDFEL